MAETWQNFMVNSLEEVAELFHRYFKSEEAPMDATAEFEESVQNAIDHFTANPKDKRHVLVLSKSRGKVYVNSIDAPDKFIIFEPTEADLTEWEATQKQRRSMND